MEADFIKFKEENGLQDDKFLIIGKVNYEVSSLFWEKGKTYLLNNLTYNLLSEKYIKAISNNCE